MLLLLNILLLQKLNPRTPRANSTSTMTQSYIIVRNVHRKVSAILAVLRISKFPIQRRSKAAAVAVVSIGLPLRKLKAIMRAGLSVNN